MLKLEFTSQFKRDYKLAVKRGCAPEKLEEVVGILQAEKPLPAKYRDHDLTNSRNYKDMCECHIEPDWLLVYQGSRRGTDFDSHQNGNPQRPVLRRKEVP